MGLSTLEPRRRAARLVAALSATALLASVVAVSGLGVPRAAAFGDVYADFSTQPLGANIGGGVATGKPGVPWSTQPVVSLYGDWNPTLSYTVDLQIDPSSPDSGGPGWLSCSSGTSLTMSGGEARFRGCSIDTPGDAYRLLAVVTPYDPDMGPAQPYTATSLPFTITGGGPGPTPVASAIAFTTQPLGANLGGGTPSAPSGKTWSTQPVVSVVDSFGNVVSSDDSTVIQLAIAPGSPQSGGPGTLNCTSSGNSARVHNGVARFSGCSITTAGQYYQLQATTYSSGSTQMLSDISLGFNITASGASRVKFTTEPLGANLGGATPSAPSGTPWNIQPVVSVVDASGRTVTSDYSTYVTLSIDSSSVANGGQLYCSGGNQIQVWGGVAAFSGCQIVGAGNGYILRATGQTATGNVLYDLSLPFNITANASALELFPSTFAVNTNGALTLSATLSGTGVSGQTITFQRQGATDSGWVNLGTSVTNANGTASLTVAAKYTAQYRATFAGSGSLQAATSAPDTVAVRSTVSLSPATSSVKKGTTVKYSAKVSPVPPGSATVRFQISRYVSGEWVYFTQKSARVNSSGVAVLSYKWATAGKWRIVAIAPATAWYTQSSSRTITITVK